MATSALSMSYEDVMNRRKPVAAPAEAPKPRAAARPAPAAAAPAPRAAQPPRAPAPQRVGGLYADANREIAAPFQRQDVRRIDMMGGAAMQRPGLDVPPRAYPANTQAAPPRRAQAPAYNSPAINVGPDEILGAMGRELGRGAAQGVRAVGGAIERGAQAVGSALGSALTPSRVNAGRRMPDVDPRDVAPAPRAAMPPARAMAAAPVAAAAPAGDNYTNSPERAAWQQSIGLAPGQRVDPNAWREQAAREALANQRRPAMDGSRLPPGNSFSDDNIPQGYGANRSGGINQSTQGILDQAARMSAIRESTTALRDELDFNSGRGGMGRKLGQDEIIRNMLTSRSRTDRTNAMRMLEGREGRASDETRAQAQARQELEREQMRGANALALGRQSGEFGLQEVEARQRAEAPHREAQTALARAQTGKARQEMGPQLRARPGIAREEALLLQNSPDGGASAIAAIAAEQAQYDEARKALAPLLARGVPLEELLADPDTAQYAATLFDFRRPPPVGFANGGLVQAQQALPEVNEYREYSVGAKSLGLPAVPFEQFVALRQGAKQIAGAPGPVQPYSAMGFANGGVVPDPADVSGRQVFDPNPMAQTDSIPAVIDGATPAKLDSGEFVIPADVVKFFGTDKLNKMIAAARQGQE